MSISLLALMSACEGHHDDSQPTTDANKQSLVWDSTKWDDDTWN